MKIESSENFENEQSPEEIKSVLEMALSQGRHVNLTIADREGNLSAAPDLIIEELNGDDLMMTFLEEDGEVGALIPLQLSRVKNAELI